MDKYYKSGEKVKNEYTIIKEIGEGRYGIAYLAENENKEKVVIKQLKKNMLKETRKELIYEQKILRCLHNPAFPTFIGKFKEPNRKGYILEYFEGKDFEDLVASDQCRQLKKIYEK